jgi:hypothetical protein
MRSPFNLLEDRTRESLFALFFRRAVFTWARKPTQLPSQAKVSLATDRLPAGPGMQLQQHPVMTALPQRRVSSPPWLLPFGAATKLLYNYAFVARPAFYHG